MLRVEILDVSVRASCINYLCKEMSIRTEIFCVVSGFPARRLYLPGQNFRELACLIKKKNNHQEKNVDILLASQDFRCLKTANTIKTFLFPFKVSTLVLKILTERLYSSGRGERGGE